MTMQEIKELAKHAARKTAPANFTNENVNDALHDAIQDLAGSINGFMKNRYDIYEIIIENADEVVPNRVISAIGQFADVQVVGQGQKPVFKSTIGKARARKFLTQVGLSGVYETARLDTASFEVPTKAVGGALTLDFERFLDGAETLADIMDVITEGEVDAVYGEVQKALVAAINVTPPARPSNNKYSGSGFSGAQMQNLITTVKSYGPGAVIFATPEFIDAMGPDAIVAPVAGNSTNYGGVAGVYAPSDIEDIHMTGRVKIFRGTPVVEIPQSYIDETNTQTWINPQFAYILPTGREKVVKVVLEGATQIHDFTNRDNSIEIHAYKKMGCAILHHYNWAVYQNTNIVDHSYDPYGN